MNAVEIEEAISELAAKPFDAAEFPYKFLEAFGNKSTTIKSLKKGTSNNSDVDGAVLQRNNIHMLVTEKGAVKQGLDTLRESKATSKQKAKFILATDGEELQAEDVNTSEVVACVYQDFPNHFGFFLALAGISTTKQIRESSFDIQATSRLNKLYIELLRHNPDWGTDDNRHNMNHFMARLIFCFFAEDTDIFKNDNLFTGTIEQMTASDTSITHEVIAETFCAMNTKREDHESAGIKRWAKDFPYVNGGLFSGSLDVPVFSKIARAYLLKVGGLDWQKINPDIFGSMIQAVADDDERGELGMHYTSVPNILKVLDPLFLDDLREQFTEAGDSTIKLLNLRKRIVRIRVFDPACGSGNFLVIAYKEMRKIEADINKLRGEPDRASEIPLTNFRGIEIRDFSAEIARLALIIAEYQSDVLYRGKQLALAEFLPLNTENWITCANALRIDWLKVCPPTGITVKAEADNLFSTPLNQPEIDFENEGGETYICGNPPYLGATGQSLNQKEEMDGIFKNHAKTWKSLDYVACWFMKAADYGEHTNTSTAFVSTNSICQGQQVPTLWPLIFKKGYKINFAHTSFKWANLASHNAGVTVVIIGISNNYKKVKRLFSISNDNQTLEKDVDNINAYLVAGRDIFVDKSSKPISLVGAMVKGNMPVDDGNFSLTFAESSQLISQGVPQDLIRPFFGAAEAIRGLTRFCIWVSDENLEYTKGFDELVHRFEKVKKFRELSRKKRTREAANWSHKFDEIRQSGNERTFIIPSVSSENRRYLPICQLPLSSIVSNAAFALFDAPLWNMAVIASRLHLTWVGIVCGKLKTDFRYSNTLGWNTFPIPTLTEKNKEDLTRCAEDILVAREEHFPATIADLYDSENMPENLRQAHEQNDEVLERIYIGRRFKNDTERLEKLFELYTKMTTDTQPKEVAKA